MPHFKIVCTETAAAPVEVDALNPAIALQVLSNIECAEADVFENERYIFSVHKGHVGAWTIFQRAAIHEPGAVSSLG
jgi:hypothetical protein